MALAIPIVSTFDNGGVSSAIREFKNLESASDKVGFVAQKAAKAAELGFLALGAAGVATAGFLLKAAQAAGEDEAAQVKLESQIRATVKVSDAQVESIKEFIDKTQRAVGVSDDNLRPAFGRLLAATKDVQEAQDLLNVALDLAAITGKSVETTSLAIARAQEGAFGPLDKLGLGYEKGELKAMGFNETLKELEIRFSGAALDKANTFEGTMARLKLTLGELQESIGAKVLPILTDLGDAALRIAESFGLKGAAGGVKQLGAEIVGLGTDASGMKNTFASIYDAIVGFVNGVQAALAIPMAAINFLRTGELGNYTIKKLPSFADLMAANPSSTRPVSTQQAESMFGGSTVSGAPTGFSGGGGGGGGATGSGGRTTPTKVTGTTPDPVFTDMGQGLASDFSQTGYGNLQGFGDIIFNVNGGDPNAVVDALRDFIRNNGSVPIVTAGIY
jgi:hypothetical protein